MVLVTDIQRTLENGDKITGYYMDGYLARNLAPIPVYLKAAWDVVGIVSGHGKVRIGKSTIAAQIGYYIAWLIAGGEMFFEENEKGSPIVTGFKKPDKEVRFNLDENVVFSSDELQKRAFQLYEKYGKNQVIIYDEGRQGLDSSRAMENINKGMQDFFQECGFMGHVIIIVVPNFFKLHEDYAVPRSLFLIDVYAKDGVERGFFNFYNEHQKELLYFFGKKKLGITAKYASANPSFWGRFTKWLPFDKDKYEKMKAVALERKRKTRLERRIKLQRDALIWLMYKRYKIPLKKIGEELKEVCGVELGKDHLTHIISYINELKLMQIGY